MIGKLSMFLSLLLAAALTLPPGLAAQGARATSYDKDQIKSPKSKPATKPAPKPATRPATKPATKPQTSQPKATGSTKPARATSYDQDQIRPRQQQTRSGQPQPPRPHSSRCALFPTPRRTPRRRPETFPRSQRRWRWSQTSSPGPPVRAVHPTLAP